MRMIFGILLALVCALATQSDAQERLSDLFSAQGLTQGEKRMLQAGLALEGHYNALLDGAWGGGSQRALVAMVKARHEVDAPNWNHVSRLVRRTQRELRRGGWQVVAPQGVGASAILPLGQMERTPTRSGLLYATEDRGLRVQLIRQTLPQALTLATAMANRHVGNGRPYQSFSNTRLIQAITLDGGGAYMRSAEAPNGVGTVLVEWRDAEADRARLIIASIASGRQADLTVLSGGALDRALTLAAQRADDTPAPAPAPPVQTAVGAIAGTGFYVNNTDIVTAAAVVERCAGRLRLSDGARLRNVVVDAERGVAVLTSGRRSPTWMPVGRAQLVLGQRVRIATFAPNATGTDAQPRIDAAGMVGTATGLQVQGNAAPTQFGSSLMNDAFELAGLIAPVSPRVRGASPYVPSQTIAAALRDARVLFARQAQDGDAEVGEQRALRVMRHLFCAAAE